MEEPEKPEFIEYIDEKTGRKEFTILSVECNPEDLIIEWFKKIFGGNDET